jgi:hypothetical protein
LKHQRVAIASRRATNLATHLRLRKTYHNLCFGFPSLLLVHFFPEYMPWPAFFSKQFQYHSGIRINFESFGRLSECCNKLFEEGSKRISQCFERASRNFTFKSGQNFKPISTHIESTESNILDLPTNIHLATQSL